MERVDATEVFSFAQAKFSSDLDLKRCPHRGLFAGEDARCNACDTSLQCDWLKQLGDVAALDQRSLPQLLDSLELAITSIYAEIASHQQTPECACPSCRWLKEAEAVYENLVRQKA